MICVESVVLRCGVCQSTANPSFRIRYRLSESPFFQEKRQIDEAVRKAPFVVVPRENFDQPASDDQSGKSINNGRSRISPVIARHQGFVAVAENALERAGLCSFAKGRIYLGHCHFALQSNRQAATAMYQREQKECDGASPRFQKSAVGLAESPLPTRQRQQTPVICNLPGTCCCRKTAA